MPAARRKCATDIDDGIAKGTVLPPSFQASVIDSPRDGTTGTSSSAIIAAAPGLCCTAVIFLNERAGHPSVACAVQSSEEECGS
mmetsp:Transcript_113203/g.365779  ORF Transcript_113203/g.365779 Transcript_113203/m.365779 type:complete len:84 (-) Transcript_113203:48-299(-)